MPAAFRTRNSGRSRLGVALGGARRWASFGPLRFQPAEVAKLGFILYVASWFEGRERHLHKFWESLGPFLLLVGVFGALLLLQPNLGTFGILALTALAMLFLAGGRFRHLATIVAAGVGLLFLAIRLAPYRLNLLLAFLDPSRDPQGIGYQISQALLAIGSGGLFGRGLGHSVQKFNYLPEAVGDSIFAILVEELGLIGGAVLIALFLFIGYRGFIIAKRAPDSFGRLLAGGITSWILIQAFVNIAAISGLIPLTGVPLPFVSYGGTSLAVLLTAVGILASVSKYARRA
ncbi:cell division protein FtsW [Candidatus Azambacteria bacterium]|nr:cell division protein FtsW [Candidatus Azambacteria bacterium]